MMDSEATTYSLTAWYVLRTTTDKLSEMLNGFTEEWSVTQVEYLGGRDWVVIARRDFKNEADRDEYNQSIGG